MPNVSVLVTATVLNTKIGKFEDKIPDTRGLVTSTVLNTHKKEKLRRKFLILLI